ncbi:MAG: prevent-host-death protein [Xanthomonadales bacterium]|nr:prevent-host-death protein [Xanthomonadales bacterium]
MRCVSLRDFRTRGTKALEGAADETVLLSGQQGPAYFLVPALGDIALEDRDLRRALARAALRASWREAEASGLAAITDREIDAEIEAARVAAK